MPVVVGVPEITADPDTKPLANMSPGGMFPETDHVHKPRVQSDPVSACEYAILTVQSGTLDRLIVMTARALPAKHISKAAHAIRARPYIFGVSFRPSD